MLSIISSPFLQDDVIVTLIVPLLTNGFFLLRPDICAFISKPKVCMEENPNFFFFFYNFNTAYEREWPWMLQYYASFCSESLLRAKASGLQKFSVRALLELSLLPTLYQQDLTPLINPAPWTMFKAETHLLQVD